MSDVALLPSLTSDTLLADSADPNAQPEPQDLDSNLETSPFADEPPDDPPTPPTPTATVPEPEPRPLTLTSPFDIFTTAPSPLHLGRSRTVATLEALQQLVDAAGGTEQLAAEVSAPDGPSQELLAAWATALLLPPPDPDQPWLFPTREFLVEQLHTFLQWVEEGATQAALSENR